MELSDLRRGLGASPPIVLVVLALGGGLVVLERLAGFPPPMDLLPARVAALAGGVLMAAGAVIYGWSLALIVGALRRGTLVTGGPYARIRHPIHAAWMLLIVPGLALVVRSWAVLAVAPVYYCAFRLFIGREEADLLARFGSAYSAWRARTNYVCPFRPPRPGGDRGG